MSSMFYNCSSLESLDLSGLNTSSVTDMSEIFSDCSNLTSLNLSGWDLSNAANNLLFMFNNCSKLQTIIMKGCSEETKNIIKAALADDYITGCTIVTE